MSHPQSKAACLPNPTALSQGPSSICRSRVQGKSQCGSPNAFKLNLNDYIRHRHPQARSSLSTVLRAVVPIRRIQGMAPSPMAVKWDGAGGRPPHTNQTTAESELEAMQSGREHDHHDRTALKTVGAVEPAEYDPLSANTRATVTRNCWGGGDISWTRVLM